MTSEKQRRGPTRALDQVRDILFGGRVAELLERIGAVEQTLREELTGLRAELSADLLRTTAASDAGDEALGQRLAATEQRIGEVETKGADALAAARASITAHVEEVAARIAVELQTLEAQSVGRSELGRLLVDLGQRLGADAPESERS